MSSLSRPGRQCLRPTPCPCTHRCRAGYVSGTFCSAVPNVCNLPYCPDLYPHATHHIGSMYSLTQASSGLGSSPLPSLGGRDALLDHSYHHLHPLINTLNTLKIDICGPAHWEPSTTPPTSKSS